MQLANLRIALVAGALALAVTFAGVLGASGTAMLASGLCTVSCDVPEMLTAGLEVGGSAHEVCAHGHGCLGGGGAGHAGLSLLTLAASVAIPVLRSGGRLAAGPRSLYASVPTGGIDRPPQLFT